MPTPTLVQATATYNTSASSLALAYGSNVTAGNLLVVSFSAHGLDGSTTTASIADTRGNIWTLAGPLLYYSPFTQGLCTWYAVAASSGADTVTVTLSASQTQLRMTVQEFSNVNSLDQTSQATGSAYPLNSGSKTTTAANEIVFGWALANGGTTAVGSGFTAAATAQSFQASEYQVGATAGSYAATYPGDGTSGGWACQMATFMAAGPPTGTATISLGPLTLTSTGTAISTGTATAIIGPLAFSATGTASSPTGTATLLLGPLTIAATGTAPAYALLQLGPLVLAVSTLPSGGGGSLTRVRSAPHTPTTIRTVV